jgi:hypothetical protein
MRAVARACRLSARRVQHRALAKAFGRSRYGPQAGSGLGASLSAARSGKSTSPPGPGRFWLCGKPGGSPAIVRMAPCTSWRTG